MRASAAAAQDLLTTRRLQTKLDVMEERPRAYRPVKNPHMQMLNNMGVSITFLCQVPAVPKSSHTVISASASARARVPFTDVLQTEDSIISDMLNTAAGTPTNKPVPYLSKTMQIPPVQVGVKSHCRELLSTTHIYFTYVFWFPTRNILFHSRVLFLYLIPYLQYSISLYGFSFINSCSFNKPVCGFSTIQYVGFK